MTSQALWNVAAENSEKRLRAGAKYMLLAVLVKKRDNQAVAYTLTNSFQVGLNDKSSLNGLIAIIVRR